MSITTLTPQGPVPAIGIPNSVDPPRLVFAAPYFSTVPIAEVLEPSVLEAVQSMLPTLVPPYVQSAANTAVANLAVQLTGSTMSGPLFLSGLPTQPTQAADKAYVDMMVSTGGVPEVPAVPSGQTWARQTGQWVPLQQQAGNFLSLTGGTMQGGINMGGNSITNLPAVPVLPNGAAPAEWVLNQISASSLYQGTWNADTNQPDLTLATWHQNNFSWIAVTTNTSGTVISWPIPGLQGLTVYNGDNIIYSAMVGQFQQIHSGGLTLAEANATYLPFTGGNMTGPLMLSRDPVNAMEAATREWVLAQSAFPEAPNDGQIYGRSGLNHNWIPALPINGGILTGALTLAANASSGLNPIPLQQLNSTLQNYVPLAGNVNILGPITMTGASATLTLAVNAASALQAVPLQQLTGTLASYAPLASPAMTGTPTVPTAAVGTNTTQAASTAYVQAAVAATPALNDTGRNFVQNAVFAVQQRGLGAWTTSGAYTADRWCLALALDTVSVTVISVAPASIGPDPTGAFCLRNTFTGNAGATAYNLIYQPIEDVRRLGGQTVTVSFIASTSGATGIKLGVSLDQIFGTGGSPTAPARGNGQAVTITPAWTRYSLTFTLPSVSGATLGTNNDSATQLIFWFSSGANTATRAGSIGVQSATVYLYGTQLELGTQATPLDRGGTPQQQLSACQRFYIAGNFNGAGNGNAAGAYLRWSWQFPVSMRASPTMAANFSGNTNVSSPSIGAAADAPNVGGSTTAAGNWILNGTFTASADL